MNIYKLGIEISLLVVAISLDGILASLALGIDKVKISWKSAAAMNLISALMLFVFLFIGRCLGDSVQIDLTKKFGFFVLVILGLLKLCDGFVKWLIRKWNDVRKEWNFKIFDLTFLLTIYADPNQADADRGGVLSVREAVSLGIALSLDSAAAGIGAGVLRVPMLLTSFAAFAVGFLMVYMGAYIGNHMAKHIKTDFTWVSGLLFLVLAYVKYSH